MAYVFLRVACSLEYEYLEKLYLEFNLEKVNLDRSHSITVVSVGNLG